MVQIAIVGCGAITRTEHLPAVLRSPKTNLHALIDSNPRFAEELAATYGLQCRIATDLSAVIDQVEGVLIATPNDSHYAIARLALEQRKPVLIEKPMTTRYEDAMKLVALAEQMGSFIAVGYKTRYYPAVQLLKRLLDTPYLGRVNSFRFEAGSVNGWDPVSGYNIDRAKSGGGVLIVKGSHFLDRMLYWFGEPSTITYEDDSYGGIEANCRAEMTFDNPLGSFKGHLFLSKTFALSNILTIDCSEYIVALHETETDAVKLYPRNNPDLQLEVTNIGNGLRKREINYFQIQLEEFADRIVNPDRPLTVDGSFAACSVKLTERMYAHRRQLPEPWVSYIPVPSPQ
jgi:predicted dehydrogenase